ncbi:PEP-CTERM sorting domain-containing protein [Verrucomicrobium sp. BvORR034]|uniref:PEP-CTERM sorting domain-containing protein n=1 Tax=Verrucomicrobium sp. BvORR034 TaxID=1396418 RepID=UPI000679B0DC|nr:PEP-CTERM sorting domain-containing protein [Verrucomicrobium sp. BvORR034]
MIRSVFVSLVLLLLPAAARAVTIVGYDPALHDRFASGYPTTPVVNSSAGYVGAGYDFSGVGWSLGEPQKSITMISDQYFVYSGHYEVTGTVQFRAADGSTVTRTVDSSFSFAPTGEVSDALGDLRIGRLTSSVTPTVASYAIFDSSDYDDFSGLPLLVYGHGSGGSPRIGINISEGLQDVEVATGVFKKGLVWDQDSALGEALLESGDSGSPTFAIYNGQLVLLGTHYGVGGTTSVDDLLALYLESLAAAGIPFSTVPEPGKVAFLLLALGSMGMRRKRQSV